MDEAFNLSFTLLCSDVSPAPSRIQLSIFSELVRHYRARFEGSEAAPRADYMKRIMSEYKALDEQTRKDKEKKQ